ncbi:hypothetical protein LCGC14_1040890 [marine sediment metagenome]|uniref:Uncharacterized protein n=1 Tax=marine sediment metagenome TaxID=412755 RepID=A0A0F9Q9Y8_9ZZZZ
MTEEEIRAIKLAMIRMLADRMVHFKFNEYKDFKIEDDKPIAYLDATIDILNVQIKKAEQTEAKLVSFNKLEQERKNLTEEEYKQLQEDQNKINEKVDSFLATLEPRCSLRGNIHKPNTIILRYRGHGVDNKFSEKYPFGVLM